MSDADRARAERRAFRGLVAAFIKLDLRGEHYGQATRARAKEAIPALFWVVGQMLAASALLTAILFARVDVWFFAFASLSALAFLIVSAVITEFHEAVFDPRDVGVLGHRPISPRTYASARFANLLLYVAFMALALTIFPAITGAGLRDAGILYVPAYLLAAACVATIAAALTVIGYTVVGAGSDLDGAKTAMAWTQIVLILVLFYAGQLMLRDATGGLEMFAAQPPAWIGWHRRHRRLVRRHMHRRPAAERREDSLRGLSRGHRGDRRLVRNHVHRRPAAERRKDSLRGLPRSDRGNRRHLRNHLRRRRRAQCRSDRLRSLRRGHSRHRRRVRYHLR